MLLSPERSAPAFFFGSCILDTLAMSVEYIIQRNYDMTVCHGSGESMSPCELASTITAIACAIAKCVPKEELPILIAAFGQLASVLGTITVQEDLLNKASESTPPVPTPEEVIVTMLK